LLQALLTYKLLEVVVAEEMVVEVKMLVVEVVQAVI
jgi:hypothetical protein